MMHQNPRTKYKSLNPCKETFEQTPCFHITKYESTVPAFSKHQVIIRQFELVYSEWKIEFPDFANSCKLSCAYAQHLFSVLPLDCPKHYFRFMYATLNLMQEGEKKQTCQSVVTLLYKQSKLVGIKNKTKQSIKSKHRLISFKALCTIFSHMM